jgi:hypothetical protein
MSAERAATPEQSRHHADFLVDNLQKFFSLYDWIAVVTVGKCDPVISRERALLTVEGALNILKLLLSQNHSHRFRIAHKPGLPRDTAELTRFSANTLNIAISHRLEGNAISDDGFQFISEQEDGFYLRTAEKTLESLIDPSRKAPLNQRFLDALAWYGDAVGELSPAARVVKYVTAAERMTVTEKEHDDSGKARGVTEIVTRRAAILCYTPTENDLDDWETAIGDVYNCRSELVHGSLSPFDEQVFAMVNKAEQISRRVLLRGLEFFNTLGLDTPNYSVRKLKENYLQLERHFQTA